MKLYELTNQWNAFQEAIDCGEFDDPQAITDTLESIQEEFDEKCEHIALLIKNLTAEADAIKAEAKNLSDRAASKERTVERLKNYLSQNLLMIGQETLETPRCKLSFRKSEALQIYDESKLLNAIRASGIDGLAQTVESIKYDKKAIKDAIKSGAVLAGASIVTNKNIQIK